MTERASWAVQVLDPGPGEQILEVRGGPGVSAALVCERLETGRLLALDRSEVAVRRTTARVAEHVAAGRCEVRRGELATLDLSPGSLEAAFAVNVNLFWVRDPGAEVAVLLRALRPGGRLLVLYSAAGPTNSGRITATVAEALHEGGFTDVTGLSDPRRIGVSAISPGRRG